MRKYLVALVVVLMVCLLGVSASAETADVEDYKAAEIEQEDIAQAYVDAIREMPQEELDIKTRIEIMTETYENAGWTVIQETPAKGRSIDIDPEILKLAYSDIDIASSEQKEKILDAREVVINQYSWHNDIEAPDCVSYVINPAGREIIFTPLFSELFPGWDPHRHVAVEEDLLKEEKEVGSSEVANMLVTAIDSVQRDVDTRLYYDGIYPVQKAIGVTIKPVCTVPIDHPRYNEVGTCFTGPDYTEVTSINVGYDNAATGARIDTYVRLAKGFYFSIDTENSLKNVANVKSCVSTFGTPGDAYIKVRKKII